LQQGERRALELQQGERRALELQQGEGMSKNSGGKSLCYLLQELKLIDFCSLLYTLKLLTVVFIAATTMLKKSPILQR
jgi:hypothetical protein